MLLFKIFRKVPTCTTFHQKDPLLLGGCDAARAKFQTKENFFGYLVNALSSSSFVAAGLPFLHSFP